MAKKKLQDTTAVLRVTARSDSFRRAGIQFGASPIDVPLADLSDEQVEAITTEPMLVAVEVEAAQAPA